MRIALFSDIHGKILLPFKLVDLYQKQTLKKVDLILQCGDIGAFPDPKTLDKATLKHAENDPDELGFAVDFMKINPLIKTFLDELAIDMICVRGNHEDHTYLDELEAKYVQNSRFPIDAYERVWVCKTGVEQVFKTDTQALNFVGIGRIGDRKQRTEPRFIQNYERKAIEKLLKTKNDFDILLSHDKDDTEQFGYGMTEIRTVLDNIVFQYHFYGHTGEPYNIREDPNGFTKSIKIKELEFGTNGVLPAACMLIIEKTTENDLILEVVPTHFTNQLAAHNWRYC